MTQPWRNEWVGGWAIDPSLAHDADHLGIKSLIAHGQTEIDNPLDIKYCLKDIKLDEWTKELEKAIHKSQETLRPLLSPDPLTPHTLDQCADALTDTLQMATATTAKIRQLCANAKPWWDNDLTQAAERVSEARKEQKRHLDTLNSFNGNIRTRIRKARNFFKRLCRIKKRDWINEKLQQATKDDIWGFQNWSKGTRNYPTPPISRGANTPKAITHQEKCDVLRNELYQPPPQLEEEHNPDLTNPHADNLPHIEVTFDKVSKAISGTSSSSAPGYSQLNYQVVKWAWKCETGQQLILALMCKCLEAGYHPKSWRKAIAVALWKPGKPDYSNL